MPFQGKVLPREGFKDGSGDVTVAPIYSRQVTPFI